MMAVVTASVVTVLADSATPVATHSSGNQLMQGYTPWYQKAAATVGPVDTKSTGGLVLQPGKPVSYLEGNSTLHKYQMHANSLLGSAALKSGKADLAKTLKKDGVDSMTLVVPVESLKSKESGLDSNAYKALNTKENPNIKFVLETETLAEGRHDGQGQPWRSPGPRLP